MTAIKPADVDRTIAARKAEVQLLLFYGPDSGRVAERSRAAAVAAVDDPEDPFQLVRLDGDDVAASPGRLVEEASTYGLFGRRRCIWVRPTSRNIAVPVGACLDVSIANTLVVIEAGDLAKSSPLRSLCERSGRAYALPCYEDEQRDLGAVIDETLRAAGLAMDADARALLMDSLGGDRLASRGELAKLVLFVHGRDRIEAADVVAAVSDVSAIGIDEAIDAAFLGRTRSLDEALRQLSALGTAPGSVLAMMLRHALALLPVRAQIETGQGVDAALAQWRGLHFRRRPAIQAQLRLWTTDRLIRIVGRLQDLTLSTRLWGGAAPTLVARDLFAISEEAAARSR